MNTFDALTQLLSTNLETATTVGEQTECFVALRLILCNPDSDISNVQYRARCRILNLAISPVSTSLTEAVT